MKGFSLLALLATPARSTDFSWDPPTGTDGLWTDAAYWSPELVPTYASNIEVHAPCLRSLAPYHPLLSPVLHASRRSAASRAWAARSR